MRARFTATLCLLALVLGTASCTYQAPQEEEFEAGMQAYAQQDYETALERWRPLAEDGNTSAQVNMGVMYFQGLGVPRDYEEAVKWYKMAALKGHAEAEYNLGVAYEQGRGERQDQREALRWYRQSAERGYVPAQMMLARMYYEGQGVAVNHAEAARWYRQASYRGFPIAQYMLGTMYATGQGVAKDLIQAHMWLSLSASQSGDATGQNTLRIRDRLAEQMTPEQIQEAERLAQDWTAESAEGGN